MNFSTKYVESLSWLGISLNNSDLNKTVSLTLAIKLSLSLLPARNKNIDEIRGKVISDYQNHLEKAWLTILKSKYSVVINLETLYSLIPN